MVLISRHTVYQDTTNLYFARFSGFIEKMLLGRAFYCVFVRQSCNYHLFEGFSCEINIFSFIELPYISRLYSSRTPCVKIGRPFFHLNTNETKRIISKKLDVKFQLLYKNSSGLRKF